MSAIDGARGASRPDATGEAQGPAAAAPEPRTFEIRSRRFSGDLFEGVSAQGIALERGARGEAVKILQRTLQELGFLPNDPKPDGIFGHATASALARFQQKRGIDGSGTLEPVTLAALDAAVVPLEDAAEIERALAEKRPDDAAYLALRLAGATIRMDTAMPASPTPTWDFTGDRPITTPEVDPNADPAAVRRFQAVLARLEKDGKLDDLRNAVEAVQKASGQPFHGPGRVLAKAVETHATDSQFVTWMRPGAREAEEAVSLLKSGKGADAAERARWFAERLGGQPRDIAAFQGFLRGLGSRLDDLARAARKDEKSAAVLAELVEACGSKEQKRLWRAGARG